MTEAPCINADLGEGIGLHSFHHDIDLLDIVDVVNIACGYHAGDPGIMDRTVASAAARGVRIGAHPGLPDLVGFGRRRMALTPAEVASTILYQVGALSGFLAQHKAALHHIKPHGALYGMLAEDEELMRAAAGVAKLYGVSFLGLPGTAHERVCAETGVPFVAELYVDLDYNREGGLVIERRPSATTPEAAAERVRRAVTEQKVLAADGAELPVRFQSICVHSDTQNAVEVASAVRAVLNDCR